MRKIAHCKASWLMNVSISRRLARTRRLPHPSWNCNLILGRRKEQTLIVESPKDLVFRTGFLEKIRRGNERWRRAGHECSDSSSDAYCSFEELSDFRF